MKNPTPALALILLAALVALLWRIERHLAPIAEHARVQLLDRDEARRLERERVAAEARRLADAEAAAAESTRREQAAQAEADRQARAESARIALLNTPVKPGEIVDAILLDNGNTINGAVVVAVQPTSVSFRAGAQLYNIPTEQLPEMVRARVHRMYPAVFNAAPVSAE